MAAQFPSHHSSPMQIPATLQLWAAVQLRAVDPILCLWPVSLWLKSMGDSRPGGGPARPLWSQSALLLNKQTLCSCTAFGGRTVGDKTISSSLSGEPKAALAWASRTPGPGVSVSVSAAFCQRRSLSGPAFAAPGVRELL